MVFQCSQCSIAAVAPLTSCAPCIYEFSTLLHCLCIAICVYHASHCLCIAICVYHADHCLCIALCVAHASHCLCIALCVPHASHFGAIARAFPRRSHARARSRTRARSSDKVTACEACGPYHGPHEVFFFPDARGSPDMERPRRAWKGVRIGEPVTECLRPSSRSLRS
jgi:hypothetical protein